MNTIYSEDVLEKQGRGQLCLLYVQSKRLDGVLNHIAITKAAFAGHLSVEWKIQAC